MYYNERFSKQGRLIKSKKKIMEKGIINIYMILFLMDIRVAHCGGYRPHDETETFRVVVFALVCCD